LAPGNDDDPSKAQEVACVENVNTTDKLSDVIGTYQSYEPELSKEIEKQLLANIDRRILPFVIIIYIFNFLDRNSITQARLYGLQEDTHTKGAEYQTAISIFSAGYIAMQLPSTLMMTKWRPSLYLVRILLLNFYRT
jgi:hypothetical protein